MGESLIIVFVVCFIIALQLYTVWRVVQYVKAYKALIPDINADLRIRVFKSSELDSVDPMVLDDQPYLDKTQTRSSVALLVWTGAYREEFVELLTKINKYLYKNSKGMSDYNLILEMVERRIIKFEEQIELLMPIPVYLGLIGTMVGIIFGLSGLDLEAESFSGLMSEIMYAMIASGLGLFLTVVMSGIVYRLAKAIVIRTKGDFLDFLQSELVPASGTGISGSLVKLQSQMVGFNNSFSKNITAMSDVMEKVYKNLETEAGLVQQMQAFDFGEISQNIAKMGEANVRAFESMGESIHHVAEFRELMGLINQFLNMSQGIVSTGNKVYGSLNDIDVNLESVAEEVKLRLQQSVQLQQFLTRQFEGADNYEAAFANTISRVGNTLRKSLDALEDQTKISLESIIQIQGTERQALSKAMAENRLSLGNLSTLDDIHTDLEKFTSELVDLKDLLSQPNNNTSKSEVSEVAQAIGETNKKLDDLLNLKRKDKDIDRSGGWINVREENDKNGDNQITVANQRVPGRKSSGQRKITSQTTSSRKPKVKVFKWLKNLIGWH